MLHRGKIAMKFKLQNGDGQSFLLSRILFFLVISDVLPAACPVEVEAFHLSSKASAT